MPDYFTLAEFRALPNGTEWSDAEVTDAAAYVTGVIERECQTSFVPRTVTGETHEGCRTIYLDRPYVRSLTSVTENGVTVDVNTLSVSAAGMLRRAGAFWRPWLYGTVVVTYEAGWSATPPDDVKSAALTGTRCRLLTREVTQVDLPTGSVTTRAGTILYTPPDRDHPTGFPDVDSVIVAWRDKLAPLAIA